MPNRQRHFHSSRPPRRAQPGLPMANMEDIKEEVEEVEEEEEDDDYIEALSFKINDDITLNQLEILHIYACVHWAKKDNGERWTESEIRDLIGHTMLNLDDDKYKKFDLSNLFKTFRDRDNPDTMKAEDSAENIQETLLAQITRLAGLRKHDSRVDKEYRSIAERFPPIDEVLEGSSRMGRGGRDQGKK